MFLTRLISSVVLVLLALFTIISGKIILIATLLFVSLVGLREYYKAVGVCASDEKMNGLEIVGYITVVIYYILLLFQVETIYLYPALILQLMAFMAVYVFSFPKFQAAQVMKAFFGIVYVPVLLSFIYLTRSLDYGVYTVWLIFISSWICDTCAYCVGMLFGRHKLAPVLSPKKSIEGALGGIAGAAAVGSLYAALFVNVHIQEQNIIWVFALICAIGAVISQIGDLAASGIKRNYEIKDYGKLIPGHGGILDRFDSVIFTAPMIYFLTLLLINYTG